jgi:hypothetical protein
MKECEREAGRTKEERNAKMNEGKEIMNEGGEKEEGRKNEGKRKRWRKEEGNYGRKERSWKEERNDGKGGEEGGGTWKERRKERNHERKARTN